VLGLLAIIAVSACSDAQEQIDIRFRDVAEEAGITFTHFGGQRSSELPEDMGSGAAWLDYNNDGWQDLFIANIAGPLSMDPDRLQRSPAHCALYRNNGDGSFTDVSASAGVDLRARANGVARGDYNNDGWTDLFVTTYGTNHLFRNRGDGTFEEVTATAGIGDREGFWAGASWGDYDRDGDLDLYVTGYLRYDESISRGPSARSDVEIPVQLNPSSFRPRSNLLYRNRGDGTFVEVADSVGVSDPRGAGLGAAWADFSGDGWPDLYVANDVSANALFVNERDGTFKEVAFRARVADYRGGMGLAVGDWDHDKDLDLFITHWMLQRNAFYVRRGTQAPRSGLRAGEKRASSPVEPSAELFFTDEIEEYGLNHAYNHVGWGTGFFDFDNDGHVDLFVTNGSTAQKKSNPRLLQPQDDMLFWNRGDGRGFYRASERIRDESMFASSVFQARHGGSFSQQFVGRGAAFADYDRDGDVDILVVNHGGPAQLFQNRARTGHHWLQVRAEAQVSNRSAIGTRLQLHADTRVQMREVGAQPSYLSQNSLVQHFGLGTRSQVDSLVVLWPSGQRHVVHQPPIDTLITVREAPQRRTIASGAGHTP
jgi:hypothetical protein